MYNFFNKFDLENSIKGKTIKDVKQYKNDAGYALLFEDGSWIDFHSLTITQENGDIKGATLIDDCVQHHFFREREALSRLKRGARKELIGATG
ncbi:hypothetical protein QEH52_20055 [Coraliomargarita sp. SDUM461003]|uniref:Uncharacterized protein n=1 Tax=Thalassobacterium maritimum TaxID=3041265 RepID=A0ABU1B097_9BACT|nr:hypothetical protein [Coraliomargarita sp. SDUM461003]MDQ8209824.1 hypothetical protein [Coraliomargarita sp. SDUM461003]